MAFTLLLRVRYAECDAQAIAFHARWSDWVDLATTELLRAVLGSPQAIDYRLVQQQLRWEAPIAFDAVVALQPTVEHIGTTSFRVRTSLSVEGARRGEAETVYVAVAGGQKTPVGAVTAAALRHGAPGRVVDHAAAGAGTVRSHHRWADAPVTPWRNGGGQTRELWRSGDGPAGFGARVSVADVASDGPFSRFPGVDRVITLLDGAGMVLSRPAGAVRIATHGRPFAFLGEDHWDCALIDGPVRDLNLMVDRDQWRAAVVPRPPGTVRGALVVPLERGLVGGVSADRWDVLTLGGEVATTAPCLELHLTPVEG
jgi:acyl-CoA thioesterase FadM